MEFLHAYSPAFPTLSSLVASPVFMSTSQPTESTPRRLSSKKENSQSILTSPLLRPHNSLDLLLLHKRKPRVRAEEGEPVERIHDMQAKSSIMLSLKVIPCQLPSGCRLNAVSPEA